MNVFVLDTALDDIEDGYRFYEIQASGLGDYFLDSIWSDIDSLCVYAGIHYMQNNYHRLLSKRFPFAIYYRIENNEARVRAILDCRKNPDWIGKRLS